MYLYEKTETNEYVRKNRWGGDPVKYTRTKKVYVYQCNECGVEFERDYDPAKEGATNVHFCKDCWDPSLGQREAKKAKLKKAEALGQRTHKTYKEIYVGPDYPYRDSLWVREHIVVMEQHIGKRIPEGMVVHHIDGDKLNNNLDNLLLCTIEEHNKCHAANEQIVFDLYKKGLVKFDKNKKEYYLGEFSA